MAHTTFDWRTAFGMAGLILGVILQLLACLCFVFYGSAWALIEVPLIAASFVLILTAPVPPAVRLGLTLWVVVACAIYVASLTYSHIQYKARLRATLASLRTEIILIPKGCREFITIHFSQPDGAVPEYEGGNPVFRIGQDGELRTQAKEPLFVGWADVESAQSKLRELYWVDGSGVRTRIYSSSQVDEKALPKDQVVAFEGGVTAEEGSPLTSSIEWFVGTPVENEKQISDRVQDENFEVPEGFHGWAMVVFDAPDGPEHSGEFQIGSSGFLRTRAHEPKMHTARSQRERQEKRHFYMADAQGDRRPLSESVDRDGFIMDFHEEYGDDCVSRIRFFVWTPAELGTPLGQTISLAHRQAALKLPEASVDEGVRLTPVADGATKVTNTSVNAKETRLTWKGLKTSGPDLLVEVTLHDLRVANRQDEPKRVFVVGVPGAKPLFSGVPVDLHQEDNQYTFYFPDAPPSPELQLAVEGPDPFWISSITALAYPDVSYREYERGVVLVNSSAHPFSFQLREMFPGKSFIYMDGYSKQDPVSDHRSVGGPKLELPPRQTVVLIRK